MSTTAEERPTRREAPGQRGGEEWKGPRQLIGTRVDLTTAALVKARAKQSGRSVSEFVADLIRQAVR